MIVSLMRLLLVGAAVMSGGATGGRYVGCASHRARDGSWDRLAKAGSARPALWGQVSGIRKAWRRRACTAREYGFRPSKYCCRIVPFSYAARWNDSADAKPESAEFPDGVCLLADGCCASILPYRWPSESSRFQRLPENRMVSVSLIWLLSAALSVGEASFGRARVHSPFSPYHKDS